MRRGAIAVMCCWLAVLLAAAPARVASTPPVTPAGSTASPARAAPPTHARDSDAAPDYIPALTGFRRLGPADGLSQASVRALVQDRHGFVWIGTQDGLNRYDGNEFRVYRHVAGDAQSLPGDLIRALAIDARGVLWVGGTGGLSRYREADDRFEAAPIAGDRGEQSEVHGLHVDRAGALWVATYEGLSRVDPKTGQRLRWQLNPDRVDPRLESLASDARGRIWLGSLAGLRRLDPASGEVEFPFPGRPEGAALATTRIDALLNDARGVLWIGTVGEGLHRFDPATGELHAFRHDDRDAGSIDSDIIRSLLVDRDGRLWVGTREGMDLVAAPGEPALRFLRFAHYRHDPRSLGAGRVMSLMQAADGSLLAGTHTGGVSIVHPRGNRFTRFTPDSAATAGLRDPVVYSLLEAGPDAVWLGGRKGLYRFEPGSGVMRDFPATAALGVSAMAADGDDLWLGVLAGAVVLDTRTGATRVPGLPKALADGQITRLWIEGDRIIAATYDRGVFVLRKADYAQLAHHPASSWVSDIFPFDDDTLLVSGSDGLLWLSRDGLRRIHAHRSGSEAGAALPAGGITHVFRDRDGGVWLACAGGGLLRLRLAPGADPKAARFEPVAQVAAHGLDIVQAIAQDRAGLLWLATAHGIARLDPASGAVALFGAADGAFDGDYQSAAVARLADGRLVFAATQGITVFDPDGIGTSTPPPAPLLTELRLWNRRIEPHAADPASLLRAPLHATRRIAIPASEARMVGLRFSSMDLPAPGRLRYAYRLDGFDRDWIQTDASERGATYTNLPPGQYTFQVKAGEPDQLDAAAVTTLAIEILPPWWQTAWARGLFVLAALALLYAGYAWRVRSITLHRQQLRKQVADRTAELSLAKYSAEQALVELRDAQRGLIEVEKMASLGSLVSGVAHEINTPLGVAVTASSMLSDRTTALQRRLDAGQLTAPELAEYLATAREASVMVDRNLERAAQLVASFKQVSIDHHSDERRRFALSDYLRTLLRSLEPSWKRLPVTFELDVEEGLDMDGHPGALAQVVGNLIQNALVHAFPDNRPGTLRLSARALGGDRVELVVADDGHGIPADVLPHVFEPFYTTRRGRGGTGLGLHITYNLVTRRLGGQIEVRSDAAGTRVIVRFPRVAKA
jgi:ligand-binding sensor domain-containing protein/signal transduction histidine kinase